MNSPKSTREKISARKLVRGAASACALLALAGCHLDMWDQPRFAALQRNTFFADNSAARLPVAGTVAYDGARRTWYAPLYENLANTATVPSLTDEAFWTGKRDNAFLAGNYFAVTPALLERGRERFNATCMPCHGLTGDGNGVVTLRGFPKPTSYHIDRLREVEDGYFFDVMTNGFGRMYSYAARVKPEDRWAIAAYIRALQTSQNIDVTNPDSPLSKLVADGIHDQEAALAKAKADEHATDHHAH